MKIQRKEKGKSKKMSWLFFRIWIHSKIFHDFLGCSRPIFKFLYIIRFTFFISFPTPYSKLFYDKNSWRYGEKNMSENNSFSLRFGFAETYYAISRVVVIWLIFFYIIRFVCPLAFQRHIWNCSAGFRSRPVLGRLRLQILVKENKSLDFFF